MKDGWVRLAGVPVLALLGQWMMYGYTNLPYPTDWRIPVFFVLGAVAVWETSRLGIRLARQRYPGLTQTTRRIVFQLVWFVGCASFVRLTQTGLYEFLGWWTTDDFQLKPYFFNTLVAVVGALQLAAVYEGIYLYQCWQLAYSEAFEWKQQHLQSQLDSLKTQINPHFLFNSLNTLSSLIDSDAASAETFLDQLSSVYRYLLRQNNADLCPLTDEMQFIDAYFHLLKTRFGEGLSLEVTIEPQYMTYLIAPLTLQLLVENAVKHNVVSPNRPLQIRLYTHMGYLRVENNLQRKKQSVPTSRTGLQNIILKYQLLKQPQVLIEDSTDKFVVSVPLIPDRVPVL